MAELAGLDVENYTQGRLDKDDPETARMLAAALAAARKYCGWHVTPVLTETVTMDGRGGRVLNLPTMKLVALGGVVEDGEVLVVETDLRVSKERMQVRKRSRGHWICEFGAVEVALTHGFTEIEAADWRQAVLSTIDQASQSVGGGIPRVIGPFQFETDTFSPERETFDRYAREWPL